MKHHKQTHDKKRQQFSYKQRTHDKKRQQFSCYHCDDVFDYYDDLFSHVTVEHPLGGAQTGVSTSKNAANQRQRSKLKKTNTEKTKHSLGTLNKMRLRMLWLIEHFSQKTVKFTIFCCFSPTPGDH